MKPVYLTAEQAQRINDFLNMQTSSLEFRMDEALVLKAILLSGQANAKPGRECECKSTQPVDWKPEGQ